MEELPLEQKLSFEQNKYWKIRLKIVQTCKSKF